MTQFFICYRPNSIFYCGSSSTRRPLLVPLNPQVSSRNYPTPYICNSYNDIIETSLKIDSLWYPKCTFT
ncbi:hypothetical protein EUGRSUZ_C00371 [Eucalyptus grandis]|uniref:Uncharacterized protein n=2 Tax=Eucalyptus grandis TaxID=71139 RepID=A0ACC3L9K5_EUCGR|nr:hypothetical protein EUGRSUZ_C00371 [Eucalyptus grandis]